MPKPHDAWLLLLKAFPCLQVDVEGCELEVLQGMDSDCWALTHQVVAEVHNVGGRLAAVVGLLEQQGFQVVAEGGEVGGTVMVYGIRR